MIGPMLFSLVKAILEFLIERVESIGLMQKYPPIFFFSMFQVFIETKYD